jgi:hypothetical protein
MRSVFSALLATVLFASSVLDSNAQPATPDSVLGWRASLGQGQVSSFARFQPDGTPAAVGILISADAIASLPTEVTDQHHCVDRDGDGKVTRPAECNDGHEFVIPLPDSVSRRADMPFKWVLLNWNPRGHIPPGVYDVPHFDVHFYMQPIARLFAIADGKCGPEFIDCEDFEIARQPVPEAMMHPDFKDVEAAVPAMGNHLVDVGGPEFNGVPFTRAWIYGVYGGQVTFYEEMVTVAYLLEKPDVCNAIKQPPAVAVSGFYPTRSCIRYVPSTNEYSVSMEGFMMRQAAGQ